jgi:FkbM family methyltransferase
VISRAVNNLHKILSLVESTNAVKAFLTWPKFSLTSFQMVSMLAQQGRIPSTVLDVGANVGQFAVAAAKLFPNAKVYSFEPVPSSIEELRKNVSKLENVTVYPFALGDAEGEVTLHVAADSRQSSILPTTETGIGLISTAQETDVITVKISTLDRVFAGVEFQPPVLLKLDVQGYEAQVISGGEQTLKRVNYVVAEAPFEPTYKGEAEFMDIVRMMEEQSFRFEGPISCYSPQGGSRVVEIDALFVRI